jgi:hypothetical protein
MRLMALVTPMIQQKVRGYAKKPKLSPNEEFPKPRRVNVNPEEITMTAAITCTRSLNRALHGFRSSHTPMTKIREELTRITHNRVPT